MCLFVCVTAKAHHSLGTEFDKDEIEISGTVVKIRYANPHVEFKLSVKNQDGNNEIWAIEAASVTNLRKAGWDRNFLRIGDEITLIGPAGRNGSKKLFVRNLIKSSGEFYSPQSGSVDPNRINATEGKEYGYGQLNPDAPFDISGPWRNSYRYKTTIDDLEPKPIPFTEEGEQRYNDSDHFDDYSMRCLSPGLPRVFGAPYNMDIVDAGSHYQIVYTERNTPRRIYMDGRKVPADYPERPMGYSVGRWEGDTLVIETTKLLPGWLDASGLPFMGGDHTRIVERYTFSEDRLSMERVMTIHDGYYTKPLIRRRASARDDNIDIVEHSSCDPAGYYSDLLEAGELEQRLEEQ